MMAEQEQRGDGFKYWAFISYSSKDKEVATRLHRRLEGYSIPRDLRGRPGRDGEVPAKLFPVFRDRDELPLSSDLGGTIHGALQASRYLIVLCSPNSAKSRWVNEEVLHFKRLGREDRIFAVILDGEPGAAEMPGREDEECFPPALKYELGDDGEPTAIPCEPIGGDLRKGGDGWERVFLKCLAGMTGLGFDAFVRRQRKRKRRRQALTGLVAVLALAAGVWAWDYNRLKVAWYAHAEERRGVPVGIRPLSEEERSRRGHNLKFESRRGKVRRVIDINGFGNPVPSEKFGQVEAASLEVIYDEDGSVSEHRLFRRDGREVLRRSYSEGGTVVEFKDPSGNAAAAVSGAVGSLTQRGWGVLDGEWDKDKRTEITRWVITYNEAGFVAERRFQNNWGVPSPNAEGVYGVRFIRDEQGLILREQTLDEAGRPSAGRNGLVAEVRNEYGELARPVRTTYHGVDGEQVLTPGGHVEERSEYDRWGNEAIKVFLGPEGELVRRPGGFARVEARYGERGELVWQAFFGAEDKPILVESDGSHGWRSRYDGEGDEVWREFFGLQEEPVLTKQGVARMTMEYDGQGRAVRYRYFDTEDRPVVYANDGNHRVDLAYDERGNVVESSYWGPDDQPTLLAQGWHRYRSSFNEFNRVVETRYFGVDDEPTLDASGIHRTVTDYDQRGNVAKYRYFGTEGEKVLGSEGYHEYRATHDGRGNQTSSAYFGTDGEEVVPTNSVVHRTEYEFDEAGMEKERRYWGPDGGATVNEDGAHRIRYRYDDRGNEVERRSFGPGGEPVIDLSDGAHRVTTKWGKLGKAEEISSWGLEDQPVQNGEGYHRRTHRYDERGRKLTEAYFGADGRPCLRNGWSVHRLEFEYDEFGQQLTQRCFGVDGKPVISTMGYHLLRNVFDEAGRNTSFTYHGVDEKPVNTGDGIHEIRRTYDDRGNSLEWIYFDRNGKPTQYGREGYHRAAYEYDARGRETWVRYFGTDGEPVIYEGTSAKDGGYHARERVLDGDGRAVRLRFYGREGEPIIARKQQCHAFHRTYDGQGRILEERFMGVDGEPVALRGGLHLLKQTFDARGNETSERYFGVDGEPILYGSVPNHADVSKYDREGRKLEVRYLGVNDEPVEDSEGRHMIRWKYDALGQISEIAYFDAGDRPTVHRTLGVHRVTRVNSPMGQILEEINWGADGKRALDSKGRSRTVWAFDGAGRLTLHAFYGVDDEPVEVGGVARREGTYDPVTGELLEVRDYNAAGERL